MSQQNKLKSKVNSLPAKPGVYLFKNKDQEVIYIGKAKSLKKRVASYFNKTPDIKTGLLLEKVYDLDYILARSELDALILEDDLIKKYQPRYNISQRDDKTYPYLKLTINEKWPRLFLVRKKEADGALYFGKFKGKMVKDVLLLMKKLFPIRWCKETPLKDREQPCLYYRIGRCSGPCINKIKHQDYTRIVESVKLLLQGKSREALDKLRLEMARVAKEQNFEQAKLLRDRIRLLETMLEPKALERSSMPDNIRALEELQKELGLAKLPMRIEAFDISNTVGQESVGSMVVFFGGNPLKKHYRKFKIRTLSDKANDVASMHEVVSRRYGKTLTHSLPWPDLVLVDGGMGQVNAAKKALEKLGLINLPIIGLAKKQEEIFFPLKNKPLVLSKSTLALRLLQRIRDEAHRFALGYHQLRRKKRFFT